MSTGSAWGFLNCVNLVLISLWFQLAPFSTKIQDSENYYYCKLIKVNCQVAGKSCFLSAEELLCSSQHTHTTDPTFCCLATKLLT